MVGFLAAASGIGSILGGLGGLFGSKPKAPQQKSPSQTMMDQAKGARMASDKYGFNPLTMMQYGQTSGWSTGGSAGSAPPLASIAAITGGLDALDDQFSGDAARRRQADQLEIDLAQVRLDQARSGVLMPGVQAPIAAAGIGAGPTAFGRQAAVAAPQRGIAKASQAGKFSAGENIIAPGRKDEIAPLTNSPGVFEIENTATLGKPVWIPGEGEPWGIDELATGAIFAIPQVAGGAMNDYVFDGKTPRQWWKDEAVKREARRAEELKRPAEPEPQPSWENGNFPVSPYYR